MQGLVSCADAVRASGPQIAQLSAAIRSAASPEAAALVVTQLAAWQEAAIPAATADIAELKKAAAAMAEQGRRLQADAERYLGGTAAATVAEAIDSGMGALTAPLRETR